MTNFIKKRTVLIVGSFVYAKSGATGGVAFASSSLTNSELSQEIDWIKIDSTGKVPVEHVTKRGFNAFKRIIKFIYYLLFNKQIESVLLFVSDGASFIEKGAMVFIAKYFSKKVILAPRSGYLPNQLKNRLFKNFVINSINKSDFIVCQSNNWKMFFENLCGTAKTKFVVISNWINFAEYQHDSKLIVKDNKVTSLLFLGWMTREKGIFDLIEAVNLIKSQAPLIKVIFGGDGKDHNLAELHVKELGINHLFEFKGWVKGKEKLDLLRTSDIFVLPSHAEGFPNSVLEAMACQLPIILTNIKSAMEIVNDNSGIIVESNNPQQLGDSILRLYNDRELRKRMGEDAQKRIRDNFSIQMAIEKFKKILIK